MPGNKLTITSQQNGVNYVAISSATVTAYSCASSSCTLTAHNNMATAGGWPVALSGFPGTGTCQYFNSFSTTTSAATTTTVTVPAPAGIGSTTVSGTCASGNVALVSNLNLGGVSSITTNAGESISFQWDDQTKLYNRISVGKSANRTLTGTTTLTDNAGNGFTDDSIQGPVVDNNGPSGASEICWIYRQFSGSYDGSGNPNFFPSKQCNSVVNSNAVHTFYTSSPAIKGGETWNQAMQCSNNGGSPYCNINATQVNGGHTFRRHTIVTASLSPAAVAANTCAAQSLTVTGINSGDVVINSTGVKPTFQAGLMIGGVLATGSNTVSINFCNVTASPITPTASETYTFDVEQ